MTKQRGDLFIINGQKRELHFCFDPFRSFLAEYPDPIRPIIKNTAYARGYRCVWEIKNKVLYLTKMYGCFEIMYQADYKSYKRQQRSRMRNGEISTEQYQQLLKQKRKTCTQREETNVKFFFGQETVPADWFNGFLCTDISNRDFDIFEALNNSQERLVFEKGRIVSS